MRGIDEGMGCGGHGAYETIWLRDKLKEQQVEARSLS